MPTTKTRETYKDKAQRLAVDRGAIMDNAKSVGAARAKPVPQEGPGYFAQWQRHWGENPFLSQRFLVEVIRPDGVFEPNDEGKAPPLLASLPDGKRFAALRQACRASVEAVAERLMVTPDMLTAYEAGDVFILKHVEPERLRRLARLYGGCRGRWPARARRSARSARTARSTCHHHRGLSQSGTTELLRV